MYLINKVNFYYIYYFIIIFTPLGFPLGGRGGAGKTMINLFIIFPPYITSYGKYIKESWVKFPLLYLLNISFYNIFNK